MSEVNRFYARELSSYARVVLDSDFDRVTAERDAALRQLETMTADRDAEKLMKAKARIQRDVQTAKATDLHERLTAADERADVLEGLLRLARQFVTNGVELGYITMPDPETPDAAHDLVPMIDAALKPAEGGGDDRPNGCCCPPKGFTGLWAGASCPIHQGLRSIKP